MRPTWDEYFMSIVDLVKAFNMLKKVGRSHIVKIKASGYNGAPVGCNIVMRLVASRIS